MSRSLSCQVIAIPGRRDFSCLKNELLSNRLNFDIIEALTPANLEKQDRDFSELSDVEIATALSHHKARLFALDKNCDWNLFLEDDAILRKGFSEKLFSFLDKLEENIDFELPVGVHLFPEQFGILEARTGFYKILSLPDCAVGYILNQKALRMSSHVVNIQKDVADWPNIFSNFVWFTPTASLVIHPDISISTNLSDTFLPRQLRTRHLNLVTKILNYPFRKMFCIKVLLIFADSFGCNYVSSERIRTRIVKNPLCALLIRKILGHMGKSVY